MCASRSRCRAAPAICPAAVRSSSTGSRRACAPGRPVVPIIFYRALLLAADTAPIDALCEALAARGLAPAPLRDHEPQGAGGRRLRARRAGAARAGGDRHHDRLRRGGEPGEPTPLDGPDVPVFQVVLATTKRAAWRDSARGLGAADLAMHVVLPELDGRVLAGAVAFKDALPRSRRPRLHARFANRPEPDRIAAVADRDRGAGASAATPRERAARRGADARLSRRAGPHRLCGRARRAGERARAARRSRAPPAMRVHAAPDTPRALLDALDSGRMPTLPLDDYARLARRAAARGAATA